MTSRLCEDPTREDMLAFLWGIVSPEEFGAIDVEEAVYWFAAEWHGGQDSNLYSALSASPFTPGRMARKPCEAAQILYDELEGRYVH